MVPADRRNPAVLSLIVRALREQKNSHHLVSVMCLVKGVHDSSGEIPAALTVHLADRRRAVETIGDARSGRVRDFASYYLAGHLLQRAERDDRKTTFSFPSTFVGHWRLRKRVMAAWKATPT